MPPSKTVQKWISIARDDILDSRSLLAFNERYLRLIAFSAQQGAEKAIKAYLIHKKIRVPKTHQIEELVKMIAPMDTELASRLFPASDLTEYAIAYRYPDAAKEKITLKLATAAVEIAESVLEVIIEELNEGS